MILNFNNRCNYYNFKFILLSLWQEAGYIYDIVEIHLIVVTRNYVQFIRAIFIDNTILFCAVGSTSHSFNEFVYYINECFNRSQSVGQIVYNHSHED